MQNQLENRKSKRVMTHIPVKYRKLGATDGIEKAATITKDISEGGVHFKTKEFVSRACRLVVELDMPMFTKPIKAISKVAWIRKSASGDDFEIGNQFLEISKKDKELVSEYVNSLTMYNDPENDVSYLSENYA